MNNDTDGLADNDEYDNDAVVANYGYEINDNLKFESGLRYNDSFS